MLDKKMTGGYNYIFGYRGVSGLSLLSKGSRWAGEIGKGSRRSEVEKKPRRVEKEAENK
jgi:hypothetical protein